MDWFKRKEEKVHKCRECGSKNYVSEREIIRRNKEEIRIFICEICLDCSEVFMDGTFTLPLPEFDYLTD